MKRSIKTVIITSAFLIFNFTFCIFSYSQESSEYVNKAWAASGSGDFERVFKLTDECIEKFSKEADTLSAALTDFPAADKNTNFQVMIDVATCYFIKGEVVVKQGKELFIAGKKEEAKKLFQKAREIFVQVIEKYPFAQAWDAHGWFWSIKDAAQKTIEKIDAGQVIKMGVEPLAEIEEQVPVSLNDEGTETIVQYEKYGKFENVGTKDYKYVIDDPIGLAKAVGEGIHPNSSSVKFNPEYVKVKKSLGKIDHWKILNSRDLKMAFFKWTRAPEAAGIKQFYIADILERSGNLEHAIKAYYAVVVHFPYTVGWTYWQTPWYVGKVALYRIKFLLNEHPELGLELKDAFIRVDNGFDNDIRNDQFVVNPGRLLKTKKKFIEKLTAFSSQKKHQCGKVVKTIGKGEITLVKYENGDWQMQKNGKPMMLKAITYGPTKVGESPHEGTLKDWMVQDTNNNGIIDAPFEAWVDKNGNNIQEKSEKTAGDFQLMKQMGVNSIRLYHQPYKLNKQLCRQLYEKYGIYILLGDFLGKYAIGSGASWEEGTDYDNEEHQENMLKSVREMVLTHKDEPYVAVWILGNENVYGFGCNADKKPASFFKFVNKAAKLIKELDPMQRPVAVASGDVIYLDEFAKNCPDVDIFGSNLYRGKYGFFDYWDEVKRVSGKAAIITEYGCSSYSKGYTEEEGQDYQASYHKNAWIDIKNNSCGYGAGNALGGVAFEWLDEWWKAYEPFYHDKKGLFAGPFLDGYMHEELLGLCSQGDGKSSPFLRQFKKAYFVYKQLWNE